MRYCGRPEGEGQKDDVLGLQKMRAQIEIMRTELGTGDTSVAEEAYSSTLRSAARGARLLDRLKKNRDR
jgi:hypothetical protein